MTAEWRPAELKDRGPLSDFVCSDPPRYRYQGGRDRYHPYPWLMDVQSHIRELRVPVRDLQQEVRVFTEDDSLAGVVHWRNDPDRAAVQVRAIAKDLRFGAAISGLELLGRAVNDIEQMYPGSSVIWCKIDPRNETSKRLFESADFEFAEMAEGFEIWARGYMGVAQLWD